MSLWALVPAPLMLGMNLPDNDDWTTAILTSPEVLAVDQDPLGKQARRIPLSPPGVELWGEGTFRWNTGGRFFQSHRNGGQRELRMA
jgi:hypothetical protein